MNHSLRNILALTALTAATACVSPPTDLNLSLSRQSNAGNYLVTLLPPTQPAAINQLHSWQVRLSSPGGAPVTQARITVDGGMPQHGHGLPTRPLVTTELSPGLYLIEGMKFSMTGWWEIKLAIHGAQGVDQLTFNTVVAERDASR